MTDIFEFTLVFKLPDATVAPEKYLDALHEAGCNDATVGVGRPGFIALAFDREAESQGDAVNSAIDDVQMAIPGTTLVKNA